MTFDELVRKFEERTREIEYEWQMRQYREWLWETQRPNPLAGVVSLAEYKRRRGLAP